MKILTSKWRNLLFIKPTWQKKKVTRATYILFMYTSIITIIITIID